MFKLSNGYKAIYTYISENSHNVSLEEFNEYILCIFNNIREMLLRNSLTSNTPFIMKMTT